MLLVAWTLVLAWVSTRVQASVAGHDVLVRLVDDAIAILFPPVRISAHLCRFEREEAVRLSRDLSKRQLIHQIHRDVEGIDFWSRDSLDHRVLHVLDLDCDYTTRLLMAANENDMFVAPMRWLLLRDRRNSRTKNSTSLEDPSPTQVSEIFADLNVFPDSEVLLATRLRDDFVEIKSIYRPSPYRDPIVEDEGNWTVDRGIVRRDFDAASRRRRDLQGTHLKSCIVITDPNTINHLTDYEDIHIDPVAKCNYPWILNIVKRLNATVSFRETNSWGYRDANGSYSGMLGMLQRREIDIGGTAMFLVKERVGLVDYVQLYTRTKAYIIFHQPLLSSVSNIFTLPFHRSVWTAIGVFLLLVLFLLHISSKWEATRSTSEYWASLNPSKQTLSDNLMVVMGAVAQQGYTYEPYRVPPRIVTLMLLIAVLSLYASYTANIVALLQSTTDSIKTLADLLDSPLKIGAQDVIYSRYFFKSFQDPVRRSIVDRKIQPKGQKGNWMSLEEGVRRIKSELFAFHAEQGAIYKLMQETYQEEEKCGMKEIDFLNILYPMVVIQMRSPYREIIRNAALLMTETGLKYRDEKRLYKSKPKCQGQTSFISIGFTECYFALVSMGYGMLFSLFVLVLEFIWRTKWKQSKKDEPTQDLTTPENFSIEKEDREDEIA